MANKIEIINKALSLIGMQRITSIDDETQQAKTIKATYDISLASVLSAGLFSFSIKRVKLALLSENPEFKEDSMSEVYQIPNESLRIVDFFPANAKCKVEGGKVYSDTADLYARIIVLEQNTNLYFPAFIEAFAIKLAADVGYTLTNGSQRASDLLNVYESIYLPRAKSADSTQGDAPEMDADDILYAKYGVM